MNSLLSIILLLLSINSSTQYPNANIKTTEIKESKTFETLTIKDELYTLQFKIDKTENNKYILIIDIELHDGSLFISPHEKKEFAGKFHMDLGDYDHLNFDGNIIETPLANAIYYGSSFKPVIWVKENTTYKQSLNILSDDNFEVFGRVIFTIEPRCTLEQIPFAIKYQGGVMTLYSPKC